MAEKARGTSNIVATSTQNGATGMRSSR